MLDGFPLLEKLHGSLVHSYSLFGVDGQTLDNCPLFALDCDWETIVDTLGNPVAISIRPSPEGDPVGVVAQEPASHVGDCSIGGTGGT